MAFDTSSYDLLKKSKQQEALNKKNNTISTLQTQQGSVENAYKELADTLAKRRADLATKNTADNQNLDSQLKQGTEGYMQQRDQGVIANNRQSKALMDWYAKNNIANSTASADEQGRQATVLANTLGSINSDKNNFETGIGNTRNLTNLDYNNGLNDLVNQDNAAQREKAQKLAEILNQITGADNTYNSEVQSINDSIEAQKLQDLNNYRQQQEQYANQIAASQTKAQQSAQASAQKASEAQYKDYYDKLFGLSTKKVKNAEGAYEKAYSNEELLNMISGSSLDPEYKARLANELGLDKQEQQQAAQPVNFFSPFNYVQRYGR